MRFLKALDTTGYTGSKHWCGPGALALLTGMPLAFAHARLNRIHGGSYSELEGVHTDQMQLALYEEGLKLVPVGMHALFPDCKRGPTLRRFAGTVQSPYPVLIEVWKHFLVGHLTPSFRILADNWTKRPVNYTDFPKLGRNVLNAWEVR